MKRLFLLLALLIPLSAHAQVSVTLDTTQTFQTWNGWEGTEAGSVAAECSTFVDVADSLNSLVADIGITRIRLEFPSGLENSVDHWQDVENGVITSSAYTQSFQYQTIDDGIGFNPNGFKWSKVDSAMVRTVLPIKALVEAKGEDFRLNCNFVNFTKSPAPSGDDFHQQNPDEYGEYVYAAYKHLQDTYGFTCDTWEVILEPDGNSPDSKDWTTAEVVNAAKAAADSLTAHGFTPHLIAPSTLSTLLAQTYWDAMLAAGAVAHVDEISYHRYSNASTANVQAVGTRANAAGIGSAMLEHIGSTWQDAYTDLTEAPGVAWQQFTLYYCNPSDAPGAYFHWANTAGSQPVMSSRTRYLGQMMRYVKPGYVRKGSASGSSAVKPMLWQRPDGRYNLIVGTTSAQTFTVTGLRDGTYHKTYTDDLATHEDQGDVVVSGGTITLTTDAEAIYTLEAEEVTPIVPVLTQGEFGSPGGSFTWTSPTNATISAGGAGNRGTSDEGLYWYESLVDGGSLTVGVNSFTSVPNAAFSSVYLVVKSSLVATAQAAYGRIGMNGRAAKLERRSQDGASIESITSWRSSPGFTLPADFRISRSGDQITFQVDDDQDGTFVDVGTTTLTGLPTSAYVGVMAAANWATGTLQTTIEVK